MLCRSIICFLFSISTNVQSHAMFGAYSQNRIEYRSSEPTYRIFFQIIIRPFVLIEMKIRFLILYRIKYKLICFDDFLINYVFSFFFTLKIKFHVFFFLDLKRT